MEKHEDINPGELARYVEEHDTEDIREELRQFVREVRCACRNIRESFESHKMIAALADIAFFGAMTYRRGEGTDDLTVASLGVEKGMPAELAAYVRKHTDKEAGR